MVFGVIDRILRKLIFEDNALNNEAVILCFIASFEFIVFKFVIVDNAVLMIAIIAGISNGIWTLFNRIVKTDTRQLIEMLMIENIL